jgi:hypothetical protein
MPSEYLRKPAAAKQRTTVPAALTQAAPEPPLKPEGFCMVCGAPTDNWVEVDGRKQGYCPKHLSKVKIPVPPPARAERPVAAPAPTATPSRRTYSPPAPSEPAAQEDPAREPSAGSGAEGPLVQCRGVTKSGTQCRRKTRDPSGLCYQHRAQQ